MQRLHGLQLQDDLVVNYLRIFTIVKILRSSTSHKPGRGTEEKIPDNTREGSDEQTSPSSIGFFGVLGVFGG